MGSAVINGEIAGAVIERAAAGDEMAFARIVAAYHEDMARIAYLVAGDLEVAADAEQAAWAIAWRRLGTLRDPARLKAWLMSVAANEARQIMRSQRRRTVRELAVDGPASWPDSDRSDLIDLANALGDLDYRDRILIGLRYIAELDSETIGRELGLSASGVRVRLHRLLGRLRKELGDD
ncbi:MAG TPA: sigma-70 family RNA polymerase sigma factor [Candidatus Limnocylindrales bacterium]|nr:sigma-70 family RNA polymerase sigma factor [Candidatus Limnocylindrales bacterium]